MAPKQNHEEEHMDQHGPPPPSASLEQARLKGHLGHLTIAEEDALDEFKALCAKHVYYTPAGANSPASHDDGTLVRFLRARKFSPRDAFVQFKDTEIWRRDNKLDALYENIDIQDYLDARSVYPQWTGRRDNRGIPVYLYEVGKLDSKKMVAYSSSTSKSKLQGPSPSRMLRLFALYENLTRFVMPLCSAVPGRPNPETPVDQSNNIVDISHVGLKQFWNLRSHMQDASTLATAHYPETLDRIFIIGAPSFFPTVWGWIKKWFDPITTSKIFILGQHEVLPTLKAFMDIDSIPKKYGGNLDFQCGMMPVLDSAVKDVLDLASPESERLFLTAPVKWVDDVDGDMTAVGVGSIDGQERREKVATLHSFAKLALSRSNRPRYERAPTDSRPQSSMAPLSTLQAMPVSQPNSVQQNTTSPFSMTVPQGEPVTQLHQVGETNAPIGEHTASVHSTAEAWPVGQAQAITQEQPGERNGVLLGGSLTSAQPESNGVAPQSIAMPPSKIERTYTEFVTPAEEPSQIQAFP